MEVHLKTQKPNGFDDGSYDSYHWANRKPVVSEIKGPLVQGWPTSSNLKHHLLEIDRTFNGTTVYRIEKTFNTLEEATTASCQAADAKPKPKPTRLWITILADYRGDGIRIKNGEKKSSSYEDLIAKALLLIKTTDSKLFYNTCGNGFNTGFNSDDGSISAGYRIQHRPNGGWNELDVSLVHIYYGK